MKACSSYTSFPGVFGCAICGLDEEYHRAAPTRCSHTPALDGTCAFCRVRIGWDHDNKRWEAMPVG